MSVEVKIDTKEFEFELAAFINENAEAIAKQIAKDAKATTVFKDVTGKLRKSIRAKKSKFEDGGWIVKASAPHAHLVEYGTKKTRKSPKGKILKSADGQFFGKIVGPMPACPFLRPALDKNIDAARAAFGAK